ncbi:hypothetical protein [Helicobacter sp. T3_23-1056]
MRICDFCQKLQNRGTSPQLRSSDLSRKRKWAQLRKAKSKIKNIKINCLDFTTFIIRHCERCNATRGNLQCNKYKIDCHELDFVKTQNLIARNDESRINTYNDSVSGELPRKAKPCAQ